MSLWILSLLGNGKILQYQLLLEQTESGHKITELFFGRMMLTYRQENFDDRNINMVQNFKHFHNHSSKTIIAIYLETASFRTIIARFRRSHCYCLKNKIAEEKK